MVIFLRLIAILLISFGVYEMYMLKSEWTIIVGAMSFLAGVLFTFSYVWISNTRLKSYKRELEKSSVNTSENASKVEVLESKIEVLEKALKSALEK